MEDLIKKEVLNKYASIAKSQNGEEGCCDDSGCCSTDKSVMDLNYDNVEGHVEDANLSLGCGIPTEVAQISKGDTVVDLGSGAGNDVFVARQIVGETGKVIGVDFTPEMVILALKNNQKLGFKNVDFVMNDIDNMTGVEDGIADVVISNCVLNLVPNKTKVFSEINRILKVGGHFSISDIVYKGEMPSGILKASEMYSGCVVGASEKGKYLGQIKSTGFKNIEIKKERLIELPDELLLKHLSNRELEKFKESDSGIYSVTVFAQKLEEGSCCETTDSECCGSETTKTENSEGCCSTSSSTGCC